MRPTWAYPETGLVRMVPIYEHQVELNVAKPRPAKRLYIDTLRPGAEPTTKLQSLMKPESRTTDAPNPGANPAPGLSPKKQKN